jgi:hypothetical protein
MRAASCNGLVVRLWNRPGLYRSDRDGEAHESPEDPAEFLAEVLEGSYPNGDAAGVPGARRAVSGMPAIR